MGVPSIPTRIGCDPSLSGDCPDDKFLYKTYGLNIEFEGPIDPDVFGKEGVEVKVYPTVIATTGVSVFLTGVGEQNTGPAIVRIRHVPTDDNPQGHLVGLIDEGPDDGRLLVTLETLKAVELSAKVDFKNIPEIFRGMVEIPLIIPSGGANLNLISLPIKQMPEAHQVAP
ncbi:hypothetical protein [Marinobacter sp. S0848L]|uniref:hypothetical protein n=1 Tax=Marinobacter sp. S0848L TaxID=2926423 RepID=UPI001FF1449E|nr:hypothetical protein [Marinobacter sp. S0848L]MCK0105449.1 hypothetical protein [Marinobacter sp. S0848L]